MLPFGLDGIDVRITTWMARHGITLLRLSLGLVFLWFGALKLVPDLSPAEDLAGMTIARVSFGLVDPDRGLLLLALWEVAIGLGLLAGRLMRLTLLLLFVQMIGTLMPLVLFPEATFLVFPFAPTLEGQYIIKNLVIISAAITIGATVRGGRLTARPTPTRRSE